MTELNYRQIELISGEIDKQGLTYTLLKNELLDHLCCEIENQMEDGLSFNKSIDKIIKSIAPERIEELQEETLLLINKKYRIMKKLMYVLGIVSPILAITGSLFKMYHLQGASILLSLGIVSMALLFLPIFIMLQIRDTREKELKVHYPLYFTGLISGIVFLLGFLWKIMHWPGAGLLLTLGLFSLAVFVIPMFASMKIQDTRRKGLEVNNYLYISGLVGGVAFLLGSLFKIQHWPASGVLLTLGLSSLAFLFIPLFVVDRIKDTRSKGLKINYTYYITGLVAGVVFLLAIMFKLQHWPAAGYLSIGGIAITFLVFFPMFIVQFAKDRENRNNNFLFLIYLLVFISQVFIIHLLQG